MKKKLENFEGLKEDDSKSPEEKVSIGIKIYKNLGLLKGKTS